MNGKELIKTLEELMKTIKSPFQVELHMTLEGFKIGTITTTPLGTREFLDRGHRLSKLKNPQKWLKEEKKRKERERMNEKALMGTPSWNTPL